MAAASGAASAQDAGSYPAKPVTVVIPTAASVSGDILMRAFGEAVSKHLGQPTVEAPVAFAQAGKLGQQLVGTSPLQVLHRTRHRQAG
jgi:tripartite-type tricarboxylate transporter receptor subunit TctC